MLKLKHLIFAAFLVIAAPLTTVAHASDFGCQVLLCLANPSSNGGPLGVAECVPPVKQLYSDLDAGKPFPSCDLADGNDGNGNQASSYAQLVYDPFDPCPSGTVPAATDTYVAEGSKSPNKGKGIAFGASLFTLTKQPALSGEFQRACVGKLVGSYQAGTYDDTYTVNVYNPVTWQQATNPRGIDVYVDGQFEQRVRY
jgi:hypothetical protein